MKNKYTIVWLYVHSSGEGEEEKGYTTLWAESEADAERIFFLTRKKLGPIDTFGYDIVNVLEEKV